MKTTENFLLPNVFENIFREITSPNFAWFYQISQTKNKEKKMTLIFLICFIQITNLDLDITIALWNPYYFH